jgi:hypothetical protein
MRWEPYFLCHLRELIFNSGFGRFVLFNFDNSSRYVVKNPTWNWTRHPDWKAFVSQPGSEGLVECPNVKPDLRRAGGTAS